MAKRASRFGGSIGPPKPFDGVIQGGWGGCSGSGTAPNSDEPMSPVSPPKGAGDGRNGGDFVFRAICSHCDVQDTAFGAAGLAPSARVTRFMT